MSVRIVQLLCPERHCIAAIAYQSDDGIEDPRVAEALKSDLANQGLDPWCGICKSRELHTEDALTAWAAMEEARPHLMEAQRRQLATRRFIEAGRS